MLKLHLCVPKFAGICFSMGELPVLVPYIPTGFHRLRDTAYKVALIALATNPTFHKDLLSTVRSWPPVVYSVLPVIAAIEPQRNTSSMTDALKEFRCRRLCMSKRTPISRITPGFL